MQKKFLLFTFLVLALLFVHTFVFADNNLGDELKDSMNKAGDTVENVKNAVTETTDNLMNKDNSDTMGDRNNGDPIALKFLQLYKQFLRLLRR